jgi:hypothetical protein
MPALDRQVSRTTKNSFPDLPWFDNDRSRELPRLKPVFVERFNPFFPQDRPGPPQPGQPSEKSFGPSCPSGTPQGYPIKARFCIRLCGSERAGSLLLRSLMSKNTATTPSTLFSAVRWGVMRIRYHRPSSFEFPLASSSGAPDLEHELFEFGNVQPNPYLKKRAAPIARRRAHQGFSLRSKSPNDQVRTQHQHWDIDGVDELQEIVVLLPELVVAVLYFLIDGVELLVCRFQFLLRGLCVGSRCGTSTTPSRDYPAKPSETA